ncbi:VOC family protein [Chitinophaga japonensis]|uniref:Catechol-2,3-dioxygenase n=1 Tax=Chitinophaga japonensis TaxID=104662 RepID=A0A562TF59_CHIJA|nr:hypothetical protein [Chitinophaga japonensis]TWI91736.1 catechol-2,3-dioxygenase [Chitinophaga japonensis]
MRIKKVQLLCNNAGAQKAFYTQQLGLPLTEIHEKAFTVQAGQTLLEFIQTGELKDTPYHLAFNITPTLLPAVVPFLEAQSVSLILKDGQPVVDFPNWNAQSVYFYDAEQNILEFIARYNLAVPTDANTFSARHVLNVSEVGVPVEDTGAFISTMQSYTHAPVWKDYGEQFKAVGDEEGLLIVVTEGRHWFPTEHPNSFLPLGLDIQQEGRPFQYNSNRYTFRFV